MEKVIGVKLSSGSTVDPKTNKEFSWDNVVLYLEHDTTPVDDQFSTYFGHVVDTVKVSRKKVELVGVDDWPELVGCHVRLNYSVFNGKPVIQSIDVAC